ncbi:hypothetical protein CRENBAI_013491 [Crenichthys baileyi]|uniref:Uncharacterized protein n=1 Tax=Crenichthys baileyi TaxID=28760 RepID=A0AAV9SBT5_9TELE
MSSVTVVKPALGMHGSVRTNSASQTHASDEEKDKVRIQLKDVAESVRPCFAAFTGVPPVPCQQFSRVKGCIETLTSFTPQPFKYKQKRSSCVVIIDGAHITHKKNTKSMDRESNVIPNTFKNLLDTSDVVIRDASSGKGETSEFPQCMKRTCSTNQMQDLIEKCCMNEMASDCLYRQNLVQSATMIADSETMQFGVRFNIVRDACMTALYVSHIVCRGAMSRRVSFCINQLVFTEVMKLTSEFVFDIWIPLWTEGPDKLHDAAEREQAVSAGQADVRAASCRDQRGVQV